MNVRRKGCAEAQPLIETEDESIAELWEDRHEVVALAETPR